MRLVATPPPPAPVPVLDTDMTKTFQGLIPAAEISDDRMSRILDCKLG